MKTYIYIWYIHIYIYNVSTYIYIYISSVEYNIFRFKISLSVEYNVFWFFGFSRIGVVSGKTILGPLLEEYWKKKLDEEASVEEGLKWSREIWIFSGFNPEKFIPLSLKKIYHKLIEELLICLCKKLWLNQQQQNQWQIDQIRVLSFQRNLNFLWVESREIPWKSRISLLPTDDGLLSFQLSKLNCFLCIWGFLLKLLVFLFL